MTNSKKTTTAKVATAKAAKTTENKKATKVAGKADATAKAAKVATVKKDGKEVVFSSVGKSRKFGGRKIFPNKANPKVGEATPRLPNTFGFRSFELVRENPGITYEEYIALGGRNNDLNWDDERSFVISDDGKAINRFAE